MNDHEREAFKQQLRAMAAGRGDGIDLDSPERWVLKGLIDPVGFFRHLEKLIPADSILYFEGCGVVPEAAQIYQTHRAKAPVSVVRDTIFPVPQVFHVDMSPGFLAALIEGMHRHPSNACFDHVKAYREGKLLFAFHDAFDGSDFLVADRVPDANVAAFASKLGVTYAKEINENKRDPAVLLHLLHAMENPSSLRMNWPWWKKALFFWKR